MCDYSNKSSVAVLSHGTICLVCSLNFRCGYMAGNRSRFPATALNFGVLDDILMCDHSPKPSSAVVSHGTISLF